MVSTSCPLEEKIALFWHGVFATGENKLNNVGVLTNQIDMFRRHGLGRFDDLLIELSKDPAMIVWLDNHTNHKDSINENYGREILELFSMGVGNYTEDDIKECSRAFTGWSVKNGEYMAMMAHEGLDLAVWTHLLAPRVSGARSRRRDGSRSWAKPARSTARTWVEVICRQDATARFVSRHLYNYFVADEVPVPQWNETPPRDPDAIDQLAAAYFEHEHDIRSVLRVLFNSDFFKQARFHRVKSPTEVIIGTLRRTGEYQVPDGGNSGIYTVMEEGGFMGQKLLDPPSVEGWHTGEEWITSGSLVDRVNFAAQHMSDASNPGVRDMVSRVSGADSDPEELVNACLDVLGPMEVGDETRALLDEVASARMEDGVSQELILDLFKLIVSSREYQLC